MMVRVTNRVMVTCNATREKIRDDICVGATYVRRTSTSALKAACGINWVLNYLRALVSTCEIGTLLAHMTAGKDRFAYEQ